MRKLNLLSGVFLFILLLLTSVDSYASVKKDSSEFYISPMYGLYTGSGTFLQRSTVAIELGKQWDVFSLGLDIGKNNLGQRNGRDTSTYFEIRPNLNVFQQNKFTNTLTIGFGYIMNAKVNLITEFTTGIEYSPNKRFSYNVFFGTYYYSGRDASYSLNFLGVSMMYYFTNRHSSTGMFNKPGK
jgi:hypothetical protein